MTDGGVELTEDAPPEAIKALASVRHKRIGKGDGYTVVFKLWDKIAALHLLGKHLGLWREKEERSDPQAELYKMLLAQLKSGGQQ
jgi:phage terminase small subunit